MTVLQAFFYGLIQGLAEFLPISSSGHLALAHAFFGTSDAGHLPFDVLLHFATLLSVAIVFRKDLLSLIRGGFSLVFRIFLRGKKEQYGADERLFLLLCLASLPLIPASFLADRIEALGRCVPAVSALLICNGVTLLISDRLPVGNKSPSSMTPLHALFIGSAQMLGVLPGISRSGSAIAGGRICGLSGESAVRFSFLMAIPAILGASVLKLPALFEDGMQDTMRLPCLVGFLTAFSVGLGAIRLLQILSEKKGCTFFGCYTIAAGTLSILLFFAA